MPKKDEITGRPAHNRLNLVGKRFKRLVVLRFEGVQQNSRKESLWHCKCDCGNETVTTGYSLTSGNTKSCGCYHKDRTRELFSISDEEIRVNRVYYDYRKRSRQKEMAFDLAKDEFAAIMDSDCYYCGAQPSNSLVQHGQPIRPYQGIDRLDNSKGYVPDNVVPCCIVCNKMKKAMNHDEFVSHVLKIADRYEVESLQADWYQPEEWPEETCGGSLIFEN